MRFVRHIRLILVALLLPVNVYAQIQECDRLAASPFDPQKQSPGLGYSQLNASLAVPACKRATEESPQTARLWFQYGRALEKANRLPDAIYAYQEAVKLKSGAAHNNIGELYRDGKGFQKDLNKAEEYFVLAANLNSPEGKSNLSTLQAQLKKVGTPTQASTPSTQSTQTNVPAGGSTSTSPSFDCRKATTTVEKLICTNPELSKLDVSLAETYKEAVSKAPSIRDDQRSWNVEKNKCTNTDCLKTAYEDRISQLVNLIVRHDRAALRQDQASANTSNESGDKSGLDFLFKQGGYWVEEKPPGQSCDAALAQETLALVFKRYNASQTEILMRIGGQHSFKNDPSVAARLNLTINVPTQYVVIGNSPKTKIKVITGYPNGAIIEELFDLSPRDNTLVKYGVGSCSSCDQAQLRVHQSFSGPEVMHWCSGNIGGVSQTQPQTNARPSTPSVSNNQSQGYDGSQPLKCGSNVNCDSQSEVVRKMQQRWYAFSKDTHYGKSCLTAIERVRGWNPAVYGSGNPNFVQPQIDTCNLK